MDTKLNYAVNMVMDAFDDAVLAVPGTKAERIVALVDELLPRLIDRAAEAGAMGVNHDLSGEEKAAFMRLLRQSLDETKGCVAALLVRVKNSGEVLVAGASAGMKDEFIQQLSIAVRRAVYAFSAGKADTCGCPACVQRRTALPVRIVKNIIIGPKGEA
jgi:hypothetical protein